MLPNKSPEPTAVGAVSSAIAVHVTSRRWLALYWIVVVSIFCGGCKSLPATDSTTLRKQAGPPPLVLLYHDYEKKRNMAKAEAVEIIKTTLQHIYNMPASSNGYYAELMSVNEKGYVYAEHNRTETVGDPQFGQPSFTFGVVSTPWGPQSRIVSITNRWSQHYRVIPYQEQCVSFDQVKGIAVYGSSYITTGNSIHCRLTLLKNSKIPQTISNPNPFLRLGEPPPTNIIHDYFIECTNEEDFTDIASAFLTLCPNVINRPIEVFSLPGHEFTVFRAEDGTVSWIGGYLGMSADSALPIDNGRCLILLDLVEKSDGVLAIMPAKNELYENLLCIDQSGKQVWRAQLPTKSNDSFLTFEMTSGGLYAWTYSSWKLKVDPVNGSIIEKGRP